MYKKNRPENRKFNDVKNCLRVKDRKINYYVVKY